MLSLFFLLLCAVATLVKWNHAGLRLGIASLLFELGFAMFCFTAQAKGRHSWYVLAFSHPAVLAVLATCVILIVVNALAIHRENEADFFN